MLAFGFEFSFDETGLDGLVVAISTSIPFFLNIEYKVRAYLFNSNMSVLFSEMTYFFKIFH